MTDTEKRSDYTPVALGGLLVMVGVLLVLNNVGWIDAVSLLPYWPIALVVLGGSMIWPALSGRPVSRPAVPFGAVIWIVVLGLLSTHLVERRQLNETRVPGQVNAFAVVGQDKPPAPVGDFRGGSITAVFGGTDLDLRQSVVQPGESVVIDVFTFCGGAVIRVPADWQVEFDTVTVAGGVKDERKGNGRSTEPRTDAPTGGRPGSPRLTVRGTVMMGGLAIKL